MAIEDNANPIAILFVDDKDQTVQYFHRACQGI